MEIKFQDSRTSFLDFLVFIVLVLKSNIYEILINSYQN